jgi:hypothetical protein
MGRRIPFDDIWKTFGTIVQGKEKSTKRVWCATSIPTLIITKNEFS